MDRTPDDPEFEILYAMGIDSYLGVSLSNTYTAIPLQQESIILSEDFANILTITNDESIYGEWQFSVLACEFYIPTQTYDCNHG